MLDYNHRLWPSPRAVNFARYLIKKNLIRQRPKRLNHKLALEILAENAQCTVETFLLISPITIANKYYSHTPNLLKLLPRRTTYHYLDYLYNPVMVM